VLGTLFRTATKSCEVSHTRVSVLDEQTSRDIVATRGRALLDRYWGRYVAFLAPASEGGRILLRAPAGDLPSYVSTFQGVTFAYSRVADYCQITEARLTPNWEELAIRVATGQDRVGTSVLVGVSTVYPGECLEFRNGQCTRTSYWTPQQVATSGVIEDFPTAAAELRSEIKRCVCTWAGCYEHLVHLLSGGLDSSIVLACLSASRPAPAITCVNYRTADSESDERVYARAAARRARCELIEAERSARINLAGILRFSPRASPVDTTVLTLEMIPLIRRIATKYSARAVFNGNQGDAVFFNHHARLAALDFARRHGAGRDLVGLLSMVASQTTFSFWKVLADALRFGLLGLRWDYRQELAATRKLVTASASAVAKASASTLAPWFSHEVLLPPGKLAHAFHLLLPSFYYDALEMPSDPEWTDPLGSQPVVDLCLRIPTYLHAHNGRLRALARRAFESDIPAEIATRHWKSSAMGHFKSVVTGNLEFVRELLLDGRLVRERLVDGRSLEIILANDPGRAAIPTTVELLDYVCVEAWLHTTESANLDVQARYPCLDPN